MAAFNFEEYFQSKFAERLFSDPDATENHMTAATRLLEKKREMCDLEQALMAQKEEFQMKMTSLNARREELDKRELKLRESLIKFDQFLIENDVKKQRAEKKANIERLSKEEKIREARDKVLEREKLKEFVKKQAGKLEREKVYRNYMEECVQKSSEFQELRDILKRHDTLATNLKDLILKDTVITDDLDLMKLTYHKMISKNNEETMQYTNTIADMTLRKENAMMNAQKWESLWNHIQNTAARNVLLLGRVKMATENIYVQIYKQRQITPKETDGMDDQLKKIKTYISDLTDIIKESERQEKVIAAQGGVWDRLAN